MQNINSIFKSHMVIDISKGNNLLAGKKSYQQNFASEQKGELRALYKDRSE